MEKYRFGSATVYVEGDLTVSINEGPVTLEVVQSFMELVDNVYKQHGRCYLLVDATKLYSVSKEARRYLVEWSKTHQITGTAVFGAGTIMRAVLSLASRAMNLLGRRQVSSAYFATEPEARAWVDEQRQKLLAEDPLNGATGPVTPPPPPDEPAP